MGSTQLTCQKGKRPPDAVTPFLEWALATALAADAKKRG